MDNYFTGQLPFNPYLNQSYTPPYNGTIISVKGQEGCNAFKMAANSSVLLLDEDNPIDKIIQKVNKKFTTKEDRLIELLN